MAESAPVKEVQEAYDQARSLFAQKQFPEAEAHCALIEELEPDHAGALFLRGVIALESNKPKLAVHHLEHAAQINPENPQYLTQLSKTLVLLHRNEMARAAAEKALELSPGDALTWDTLGVVFSHLGNFQYAGIAFLEACNRNPKNTSYLYNLGTALKFAGDFDGAEEAFTKVLTIDPSLTKAWFALSNLRRQTREKNIIPELEEATARYSDSMGDRMQLGYALAKAYDDTGEYDKAWERLDAVNWAWESVSGYKPDNDARIVDQWIRSYTPATILAMRHANQGYQTREPIFVVGLPRSGTTLTDRILSSHSKVTSAGELSNFSLLTKKLSGSVSKEPLDHRTIKKSVGINHAELGQQYLRSTRPATGNTEHFVDKMPFNFLYTGLILQALPEAKIVCLRRNPMDVCLANYRQLFSLGHPFYGYSYDIENCARYYLLFDRLMRHWQALYPDQILELHYEDIVDNQEETTHNLLDFCELEFETQCLEFEKNTAPVATASSAQVREPLNSRGIGRWKNYTEQLKPAQGFLAMHGIKAEA